MSRWPRRVMVMSSFPGTQTNHRNVYRSKSMLTTRKVRAFYRIEAAPNCVSFDQAACGSERKTRASRAERQFTTTAATMVKDDATVIECVSLNIRENGSGLTSGREFNELVNMTADELETWLHEEQSETAGWDKGDGSGETIGHERCVFHVPFRVASD